MSKATKILNEMITRFCLLQPSIRPKVGDFWDKVKQDEKDVLKTLTSDDTRNVRIDFI